MELKFVLNLEADCWRDGKNNLFKTSFGEFLWSDPLFGGNNTIKSVKNYPVPRESRLMYIGKCIIKELTGENVRFNK